MASSKSKLHPIDSIRVQYWYHWIRHSLCLSSEYAIEAKFAHLTKSREEDNILPTHKWRHYRHGNSIPRPNFVESINETVPGSTQELNHPLWEILKWDNSTRTPLSKWIKKLDPKVQKCLFIPKKSKVTYGNFFYDPNVSCKLASFSSLDCLAGLLIMWFESGWNNHVESNRSLAMWIYKYLLITGHDLKQYGIAEPLYNYIKGIVFNRTPWDAEIFSVDFEYYALSVEFLDNYYDDQITRDHSCRLRPRSEVVFTLLHQQGGLEFSLIPSPCFEPDWEMRSPAFGQWQTTNLRLIRKEEELLEIEKIAKTHRDDFSESDRKAIEDINHFQSRFLYGGRDEKFREKVVSFVSKEDLSDREFVWLRLFGQLDLSQEEVIYRLDLRWARLGWFLIAGFSLMSVLLLLLVALEFVTQPSLPFSFQKLKSFGVFFAEYLVSLCIFYPLLIAPSDFVKKMLMRHKLDKH
jgi:hypothetical protein